MSQNCHCAVMMGEENLGIISGVVAQRIEQSPSKRSVTGSSPVYPVGKTCYIGSRRELKEENNL